MSLQTLIRGVGGTLYTEFLDRHPVSCTVSVYTAQAGLKVSAAACTIDSLSTTLATIAEAGDDSITLTSAVSCYVGRRYLINATSGDTSTAETVTVKSLSASTATLTAPLWSDHAIGSAVKGTRASYVVPAASADAVWVMGYADFNPNDGTDPQSEWVECFLRKIPEFGCDETDLRRVFAEGAKMLSANLDRPSALKQARDRFLLDLGGKNRPNVFIATDIFRDAVAMKFWLLRRFEMGDEWKGTLDDLQAAYDVLVGDIQTQVPADNDQDGTTSSPDDGGYTVGTLERA